MPQKQTHKHLVNVHSAHIYTRNHIRVLIFVRRSVSKQEHSQQLQHKLLSVSLFWQTSKWKLGRVAVCTVDCKMQAAKFLMALTSSITQQTDSFICGSQVKNAWHLQRRKIITDRERK